MRRLIIGFVVLTALLGAGLYARIRLQDQQLLGPSGGSGVIEGTEVSLSAKIAARVIEVAVEEGQAVKDGDVLLRLDCDEPHLALQEAEARLAMARAQARATKAGARAAGRAARAAQAQAKGAEAQVEALEAQKGAADRAAARLETLDVDVAEAQRDQVQAQADGLSHQAEAAVRSKAAAAEHAGAARAQTQTAQAQADAAMDAIKAGEVAVARTKLMGEECVVTAPRDATVESIFVEVGEMATPALPLLRLIDLKLLEASFYLPNAELAEARPGAQAELRVDAYPDRVFPGTIKTVAAKAEFTPRNIQTRTDRDRLVYRIELRVPNPEGLLRPGMPVQVTLPGTGR